MSCKEFSPTWKTFSEGLASAEAALVRSPSCVCATALFSRGASSPRPSLLNRRRRRHPHRTRQPRQAGKLQVGEQVQGPNVVRNSEGRLPRRPGREAVRLHHRRGKDTAGSRRNTSQTQWFCRRALKGDSLNHKLEIIAPAAAPLLAQWEASANLVNDNYYY